MTVDEAIIRASRLGALDRTTAFKFTRSTDVAERKRCAKAVADWLQAAGITEFLLVVTLQQYAA